MYLHIDTVELLLAEVSLLGVALRDPQGGMAVLHMNSVHCHAKVGEFKP